MEGPVSSFNKREEKVNDANWDAHFENEYDCKNLDNH